MATTTPNPNFVTVQEAALLLGIREKTVRRYLGAGRLQGHKLGTARRHPWRVTRASLDAILNNGAQPRAERSAE